MVMRQISMEVECPDCGSKNLRSVLSFGNFMALVGRMLGMPVVKIWQKRCADCGKEFQVFRNK